MTYRIVILPRARTDIEEAYRWMRERSRARADRWLNGLSSAIESLATLPERFPLAPEAEAFERDIRQMLYGKKRKVYRILYVVEDDTVSVLHVRHASRAFLEPEGETGA